MRSEPESGSHCPSCGALNGHRHDTGSVRLGPVENGVQVVFIEVSAGIEVVSADLERALAPLFASGERPAPIAIRAHGEATNLAVV